MTKALPPVFIDRDGVINENRADYVKSLNEWIPIPGSIEAISEISKAGFHVIVVTNQSAVARGLCSISDVKQIHAKLLELVKAEGGEIDCIAYCPHHPDDNCECRKPKTGMVDTAKEELELEDGGYMIGDAATDVEMGSNAGLKSILVLTGRGKAQLELMQRNNLSVSCTVVNNLREAAALILKEKTGC